MMKRIQNKVAESRRTLAVTVLYGIAVWLLAGLEKDNWFQTHDPKDALVGNFHKEELITRRLESKHYWFPLPDKDTYLYEGFPQNPGW